MKPQRSYLRVNHVVTAERHANVAVRIRGGVVPIRAGRAAVARVVPVAGTDGGVTFPMRPLLLTVLICLVGDRLFYPSAYFAKRSESRRPGPVTAQTAPALIHQA